MAIPCWTLHKCKDTLYLCLCPLVDILFNRCRLCSCEVLHCMTIPQLTYPFCCSSIFQSSTGWGVLRGEGNIKQNAAGDILWPPRALVLFCEVKWLHCRIYAVQLQKRCLGFQTVHTRTPLLQPQYGSSSSFSSSLWARADVFPVRCGGWALSVTSLQHLILQTASHCPWSSREGLFLVDLQDFFSYTFWFSAHCGLNILQMYFYTL